MKVPIRSIAAGAGLALTMALSGVAPLLVMAADTPADSPTVTISSSSSDPTGDNPIPFTVTTSSAVTEFDQGDLTVTGGSVVNFSGSGTSYSFGIVPGDGDSAHGQQPRFVAVQIEGAKFNNNQWSNYVGRWFDPAAPTSVSTSTTGTTSTTSTTTNTSTSLTMTGGPTNGSTVSSGDVTFMFTAPAGDLFACSLNSSASWVCASPQGFSALPDGMYTFMVTDTTASSSLSTMFTVAASSTGSTTASTSTTSTTGTTSTSTASTTDTSTQTSSSGGGSTASTPAPTPAPAPSGGGGGGGNGSAPGGPEPGHTVIPTSFGQVLGVSTVNPSSGGNAVIPTAPSQASAASASTPSRAASVSASGGTTGARTSSVKSTNSSVAQNSSANPESANVSSTENTVPTDAYATSDEASSALTASAGSATGGIPGWIWIVLLGVILIAIGIWAFRQPVA